MRLRVAFVTLIKTCALQSALKSKLIKLITAQIFARCLIGYSNTVAGLVNVVEASIVS